MSEDDGFVDAEAQMGSGFEKVSFREIILEHLRRILKLSSVEWTGGYWETKLLITKDGTAQTKIYVPSTRDMYSNAVSALSNSLLPHFDEQMLQAEERLDKDLAVRVKRIRSKDTSEDKIKLAVSIATRTNRERLYRELAKFMYRVRYLEASVIEE